MKIIEGGVCAAKGITAKYVGPKIHDWLLERGKITEEIPRGLFNLDGHPSFTKNGRYMLTDTYEDEESYRHLYIYDLLF